MIIDIDLSDPAGRVELVEPEDCRRFHVAARGGNAEALGAALTANNVGWLRPSGDAMIEAQAVRRMAEGRVAEGWAEDFAAMLKYAESQGWLDDTGAAIQAHVEWGN